MRRAALLIAFGACLTSQGLAHSIAHRGLEDTKPVIPPVNIGPGLNGPNITDPTTSPPPVPTTDAPSATTKAPTPTTSAPTPKLFSREERDTTTNSSDIDASEYEDSSGSANLEVDANTRYTNDSKLNLGMMAGIIVGVLLCIGLAFAFVHRRKSQKKTTKKKHGVPVMNSTASTTASTTYCELSRGSKGSRSSGARGGSQGSAKSTTRSVGKSAGAAVNKPANKPPRPPPQQKQQAVTRQPHPPGSGFQNASNFVSADASRHNGGGGLTTIHLANSSSSQQAEAIDSSRSIAGVMKSYRNQPPGMFEDKTIRQSSIHTRRNVDFEFTLDTADHPAKIDASQLDDSPVTKRPGYASPISEAPVLARDSSKSVDEDDLHDVRV